MFTSKLSEEEAELENHVLTTPRLRLMTDGTADVVRGQQHNSKRGELCVVFKLLEHCATPTGLLVGSPGTELEFAL